MRLSSIFAMLAKSSPVSTVAGMVSSLGLKRGAVVGASNRDDDDSDGLIAGMSSTVGAISAPFVGDD